MTTEQASHTPLPWKVVDWSKVEDGSNPFPIVAGNNNHGIAEVWMPAHKGKANAEYIVKACNAYPAMLEALRDLMDALPTDMTFRMRSNVLKARAVLATITLADRQLKKKGAIEINENRANDTAGACTHDSSDTLEPWRGCGVPHRADMSA